MSSNKLKVSMQLMVALSAAGVVTVLHNAPASAEVYSTATGGYVPTDFINAANNDKSIGGTAKAEVIKQISSASSTMLNFGKIVPSSTNGTITIAASGAITSAGGARYIPNSGATNATLSFSGDDGQAIQIDKPSSVKLMNGTNEMNLAFAYDTIPTVIPTSGNVAVNYGGVLDVDPNQAPGIYTGTYEFFVTYV